jgi:nicotinamidase/pyrazinamidase
MKKKITLQNQQSVASFDVDAQNAFTSLCPTELPIAGATNIVPELNAQAKMARLRVGSKDAHSLEAKWIESNQEQDEIKPRENYKEYDSVWPAHAIVGTEGFELMKGLPKVTGYDFFVWKGIELSMHPYGACYHDINETLSTGVIEYLSYQEVDTVIVGGLATDYCVYKTVLQLLKAQFKVIVNVAATCGVDKKSCNDALIAMQDSGAILIESANSIKFKDINRC